MTAETNVCPNCGAERPANGPEGLCPSCLKRRELTGREAVPDDDFDTLAMVRRGLGLLRAGAGPGSETTAADLTGAAAEEGARGVGPADPDATIDGPDAGPGFAQGAFVRYFGDYELQKELGRGGWGVVDQARQVRINRPVAPKIVRAGILADEAELRRFQNEAEAVALLDHAGIVPVHEVGEYEGQKYFSMKLVEGGNLAEQLAAFKDDPWAAATLLAEA